MQTNYILIDFENVHVKSLALLKDRQAQVKVFLGPKNTKIPVELVLAMQGLGEWGDYIMLEVSGHNALDFHIAYYLGKLVAEHPDGHFHIISKDTGFDSLLRHLQRKGTLCTRSPSIEMMLGVDSVEAKAVEPRPAARQARSKAEPAPAPAPAQRGRQAAPARAKNERVEKSREVAAKVPAPAARIKDEPKAAPIAPAVQSVIANLAARGSSRPRRLKTLLSTIKSLSLKLNDDEVAQMVETLQKLGKVTVSGQQVSYRI
jgi:hypothetical protein